MERSSWTFELIELLFALGRCPSYQSQLGVCFSVLCHSCSASDVSMKQLYDLNRTFPIVLYGLDKITSNSNDLFLEVIKN